LGKGRIINGDTGNGKLLPSIENKIVLETLRARKFEENQSEINASEELTCSVTWGKGTERSNEKNTLQSSAYMMSSHASETWWMSLTYIRNSKDPDWSLGESHV
jgi:hypothetical protein